MQIMKAHGCTEQECICSTPTLKTIKGRTSTPTHLPTTSNSLVIHPRPIHTPCFLFPTSTDSLNPDEEPDRCGDFACPYPETLPRPGAEQDICAGAFGCQIEQCCEVKYAHECGGFSSLSWECVPRRDEQTRNVTRNLLHRRSCAVISGFVPFQVVQYNPGSRSNPAGFGCEGGRPCRRLLRFETNERRFFVNGERMPARRLLLPPPCHPLACVVSLHMCPGSSTACTYSFSHVSSPSPRAADGLFLQGLRVPDRVPHHGRGRPRGVRGGRV